MVNFLLSTEKSRRRRGSKTNGTEEHDGDVSLVEGVRSGSQAPESFELVQQDLQVRSEFRLAASENGRVRGQNERHEPSEGCKRAQSQSFVSNRL